MISKSSHCQDEYHTRSVKRKELRLVLTETVHGYDRGCFLEEKKVFYVPGCLYSWWKVFEHDENELEVYTHIEVCAIISSAHTFLSHTILHFKEKRITCWEEVFFFEEQKWIGIRSIKIIKTNCIKKVVIISNISPLFEKEKKKKKGNEMNIRKKWWYLYINY